MDAAGGGMAAVVAVWVGGLWVAGVAGGGMGVFTGAGGGRGALAREAGGLVTRWVTGTGVGGGRALLKGVGREEGLGAALVNGE